MNIAIIFAAGNGSRMGKTILPKPYLTINEIPILIRTINVFEKSKLIDKIVLVVNEEYIEYCKGLINYFNINKVDKIIKGGTSGQESIYNGLNCVKENFGDDALVILNDGVRPFIKDELLNDLINTTLSKGNAIAVVKAVETIAIDENGIVIPNRDNCYFLKAPQCFILKDLLNCHKLALSDKKTFVDSASLVNYYGGSLNLVLTDSYNIKITTQADLIFAKEIVEKSDSL